MPRRYWYACQDCDYRAIRYRNARRCPQCDGDLVQEGDAMNHQEHKARHEELHRALDELLADFIMHNPGKLPSQTTVLELVIWAHEQMQEPSPEVHKGAEATA